MQDTPGEVPYVRHFASSPPVASPFAALDDRFAERRHLQLSTRSGPRRRLQSTNPREQIRCATNDQTLEAANSRGGRALTHVPPRGDSVRGGRRRGGERRDGPGSALAARRGCPTTPPPAHARIAHAPASTRSGPAPRPIGRAVGHRPSSPTRPPPPSRRRPRALRGERGGRAAGGGGGFQEVRERFLWRWRGRYSSRSK